MKINFGPYPDTHSNDSRQLDIHIDSYDLWNLDHTLALIIVASLKEFNKEHHGAPFVDNADVPEHLRRDENDLEWHDVDALWHDRWKWVINEMQFAFQYIIDDTHATPPEAYDRATNGRRLFAKYFINLWN